MTVLYRVLDPASMAEANTRHPAEPVKGGIKPEFCRTRVAARAILQRTAPVFRASMVVERVEFYLTADATADVFNHGPSSVDMTVAARWRGTTRGGLKEMEIVS